MSEAISKLETVAIKALDGIETLTVHSIDLIQEQSPLLIKEILTFSAVESIIELLCGLVLVVSILLLGKYIIKTAKNRLKDDHLSYDGQEFLGFVSWVSPIVTGVLSFLVIVLIMSQNLITLSKIVLAPRLYLFEFFSQLIAK